MINEEQIAAYCEMAKNASENSMEAQIRANLESTCDKFAGNEDKFDRCMVFLKNVCLEMLGGEDAAEGDENSNCKILSGDIPDEVCFRICRDYFNDEIWKAEEERREKARAKNEKKASAKSKKAPTKQQKPAPEPEPEKDGTEKPVAAVQEEPVTAESLAKEVAEKNLRIIEANNKKLGIGLAETLDLFGTGK